MNVHDALAAHVARPLLVDQRLYTSLPAGFKIFPVVVTAFMAPRRMKLAPLGRTHEPAGGKGELAVIYA